MDLVAEGAALFDRVAQAPAAHGGPARDLLVRARGAGSVEALVVALRACAESERLAPRNAAARILLDEAVALAESADLAPRLGQVLQTRSLVRQELGDLLGAEADAERASELLPSDPALLFSRAVLAQNRGALALAGELYRQVLASGPPLVRAKAGNNLAHLEAELGRTDLALSLLASALELSAGPTVRAYLTQTRASVEMAAGLLGTGLRRFLEARRAYDEAGLPLGEHHLEHAEALADLRLIPEALAAVREGLAALPQEEVPLMVAEARLHLARLSLLAGDPETARGAAEAAESLLERQGRPGFSARAVLLQVQASSATGAATSAELGRLARAAETLERAGSCADAVAAHLLLGRSRQDGRGHLQTAARIARSGPLLVRLQGHLAGALAATSGAARLRACRAGLDELSRHRAALPTMELRARASGHGEELGRLGLSALLGGGHDPDPAGVFGWLERTRAAALVPLSAPDVTTWLAPEEQAALAALRSAHADLSAARASGDGEPAGLLRRVQEAEDGVRRASWAVAAPAQAPRDLLPDLADLPRLASQLTDGALVELGLDGDRLIAVVVTAQGSRVVELGTPVGLGDTVDVLAFALCRLARDAAPGAARAAARDAARRSAHGARDLLRRRLLDPLDLDPSAPLVVVPVGPVRRVPWCTLHDGPVTVVPSAQVWTRTLRAPAPPTRVVLAAGPGLPGATREVEALRVVHPAAAALEPPESTCEAVASALDGAHLAHLACHGRLRADNPAFSELALSDGPLTVHELSRRDTIPAQVVLAACESGAQVALGGDETLGLVAALLAQGSTGVLASSGLVPDTAALDLVLALHERLAAGAAMADALWHARRDADPDEVAWWAFQAHGAG